MEKKIIKCLIYPVQVFKINRFLVFPPSFFYPFHKDIRPCLNEYNQIGSRNPFLQEPKNLLVQPEFMIIQIGPGEYSVLFKEIIRNDSTFKEVHLVDLQGVLITSEEEKDLDLKAVSLWVLIKPVEIRIILCLLQQDLPVYPLCKFDRKTGFPDPQRTFDDDMMMRDVYLTPPGPINSV